MFSGLRSRKVFRVLECLTALTLFTVLLAQPLEGQHKSARAVPHYVYSVAPFAGVVPPHFQGNDLRRIAAGLAASHPTRDAFESSLQYNARMLAAESIPLAGGFASDSLLAFVFPTEERLHTDFLGDMALDLGYDADHQLLTVVMQNSPMELKSEDEPAKLSIKWSDRTTSSSQYLGSNGFGATTTVYAENQTDYALAIPTKSTKFGLDSNGSAIRPISISFTVSPEKARILNRRIRVLVICKLVGLGPVSQGETYHTPTMESPLQSKTITNYLHVIPSEFWIFDIATGEVLAKVLPQEVTVDGVTGSNNGSPQQ
jgi:hypothetical protein